MRVLMLLTPLLLSACIIETVEKDGGPSDDTASNGSKDADHDGFTVDDGDCDDDDPNVNPNIPEVCDGIDNDCDGLIDSEDDDIDMSTARDWYVDNDGDGYGASGDSFQACQGEDGYADNDADCDDGDHDIHPDADEICDGIDNDCDGLDDAGNDGVDGWETDNDGDGYSECEGDCDDTTSDTGTGLRWYPDMDDDGFGDADDVGTPCDRPESWYVSNNEDCNDLDPYSYPGAPEVRADYIDQDCDGEDVVWLDFSMGDDKACGIDSEGVTVCWGEDSAYGALDVLVGDFSRVYIEQEHTCAIETSGEVVCWGDDTYDECRAPSGTFFDLGLTGHVSCGIRTTGTIACWGLESHDVYEDIPSGSYNNIEGAMTTACAVKTSGQLRCWGRDRSIVDDPPSGTFQMVSVAESTACALDGDGNITCWGSGADVITDVPSPSSGPFIDVSAGRGFACAVSAFNDLYCWGSSMMESEPPGSDYARVFTSKGSFQAACGHDVYGYIHCWGSGHSAFLSECEHEEEPGEPYYGVEFYDYLDL